MEIHGILCCCLVDEGVSFIKLILTLMYRMSELHTVSNASCHRIDEDEGVGCRDDPLPRLLLEVINVLSSVSQTQKGLAEKASIFMGHCLSVPS